MAAIHVNETDREWYDNPLVAGVSGKLLAVDPVSKAHAMLVRWGPGVEYATHSHEVVEQIYILEGECDVGGKHIGPGSHSVYPAGDEHGPFKMGPDGMLTLIVFSGPSGMEQLIPQWKRYLE